MTVQCTNQICSNNTERIVKLEESKKKLIKQVANLRTRICRLNKKKRENCSLKVLTTNLETLLPKDMALFIIQQIKLHNRKLSKNGYRWTTKQKLFFLSIFYHSRKAYRLLGKIFILPSRSTLLLLLLSKCLIYPGFHDNIFNSLKIKIENMENKDCVLVFDEMKLKCGLSYDRKHDVDEGFEDIGIYGKAAKPADYALCFLVKGLKDKWKLNIGYFLTSSTIKAEILFKLIETAIRKLFDVGLFVKAVICDQGPNNQKCMTTYAKIDVNKTFFK